MAKGRRFSLALWVWIFVLAALLVALVVGGTYFAAQALGNRAAGAALGESLAGHLAVHTAYQQQRYERLRLVARIFRTDPLLPNLIVDAVAALEAGRENAARAIVDVVEEYQNLLGFDLALVLDRSGRVLTDSADSQGAGADLSQDPLLLRAADKDEALGLWTKGDKLYAMLAVPLVREFDDYGFVMVGFEVDEAFARQLRRSDEVETVYLVRSGSEGYEVAATTLGPADREALVPTLRREGEPLGRVFERAETVDRLRLQLNGQSWLALLSPLRDAQEQPAAALVALTSVQDRLAPFRRLQQLLLALGGAALLAGLALAVLLSRRTMRPVAQLAGTAQQARNSIYSSAVPESGGSELPDLAGSMQGLLGDLLEKQSLEAFVAHVSRQLPEPGRGQATNRPGAHKLILLAVELRRYANPKLGYDPEETLGRLSRDLRRVTAPVQARRGRLEALLGHRVLASFQAESAALEALAAATEILLALSERENVFDEVEPPVVVLTAGHAVTGSVSIGSRGSNAVLGLPVQQLESLLREGSPGDMLLAEPLYVALEEPFARAGVAVAPQRGLMSPQPFFPLDLESARRVSGVEAPASTLVEESPAGRRTLADLGVGTVLGNRFELLAELGSGRRGVIYKARDRESHDFLCLKMLRPEVVADPVQLDRLKGQILRARSVRHPNVLSVIDFGEVEGLPYVAQEYVRGVSLRLLLEQGGQMPLRAALHLARRLAAGLAAAHEERVLHLGVKPENVLVEAKGSARLTDLGLALPLAAGQPLVVSPYYLAPEQLEGGNSDVRTDLYAFGVLLYEVLTGQPPFSGATPMEIRQRQLSEEPAAPGSVADLPPELDRLVLRCLAKAPDDRFQDMGQLLGELESIRV